MSKAFFVYLASVCALLFSISAHAALDVTVATTGINDALVAVLGVLAVVIVMAAAVYGRRKLLRILGFTLSSRS